MADYEYKSRRYRAEFTFEPGDMLHVRVRDGACVTEEFYYLRDFSPVWSGKETLFDRVKNALLVLAQKILIPLALFSITAFMALAVISLFYPGAEKAYFIMMAVSGALSTFLVGVLERIPQPNDVGFFFVHRFNSEMRLSIPARSLNSIEARSFVMELSKRIAGCRLTLPQLKDVADPAAPACIREFLSTGMIKDTDADELLRKHGISSGSDADAEDGISGKTLSCRFGKSDYELRRSYLTVSWRDGKSPRVDTVDLRNAWPQMFEVICDLSKRWRFFWIAFGFSTVFSFIPTLFIVHRSGVIWTASPIWWMAVIFNVFFLQFLLLWALGDDDLYNNCHGSSHLWIIEFYRSDCRCIQLSDKLPVSPEQERFIAALREALKRYSKAEQHVANIVAECLSSPCRSAGLPGESAD